MIDPTNHRQVREALGAHVLGGLSSDERRTVDAHLSECRDCRDEVARLSTIPGLLDLLDADEAADGRLLPTASLDGRLARAAVTEQVRLRRQIVSWRVASGVAAAAALVLFLAWGPWRSDPGPDRWVFEPAVVAGAVDGTAAAIAWEWGTTVELELADLPPADRYVVVALSDDGRREQAGTWGPTVSGSARVRGASAIARADLDQITVEDGAGQVLAVFDVAPPG